jgi:hypothetical protein
MRKHRVLFTLIVILLVLIPQSVVRSEKPPEYFVDESKLPFEPLPGAQAYWGVLKGAGYRIEVPDNWNGDLVMWAHGFRGSGLELTVDNHPLREFLIPNGYAWAASSYSKNDYDVAQGAIDTHVLSEAFSGIAGSNPQRIYLTGASMGGHITAVSVEQWSNAYDGAMPICGALADFELFDFYLDFNLAAQQLGTGSSTFPVDSAAYIGVTVPEIKANLEAIPGGWPVALNADGVNLKNLTELRSGGERPNFDEAWYFWNTFPSFASSPGNFLFDLGTLDGTVPRSPGVAIDNHDIVYQFDTDPALSPEEAAFNEDVFRVTADPQARNKNGLAQLPVTTGDIRIPVLTLHNLGDLFVPVHNEIIYAQRVAERGNRDLLVQRAIRGVGHCDFTATEMTTAFVDLVGWVESGVKPAGDDWRDPSAVAAPDFGCTFTDGSHLLGTPCP